MKDGFIRVACASPRIALADCQTNAKAILSLAQEAAALDANVVVFPELCLTGASCGDLFFQRTLQDAATQALMFLAKQTESLDLLLVIGVPVCFGGRLYDCAAVLYQGRILGLVPKGMAEQSRCFANAPDTLLEMDGLGQTVPFGKDLLFTCQEMPWFSFGIAVGQELSSPISASAGLALGGATLVLNPAASAELIGQADFRRQQASALSARLKLAYALTEAGEGESTTDQVYGGQRLILENGAILAESPLYTAGLTLADVDLQRLESLRLREKFGTFEGAPLRKIPFSMPCKNLHLLRKFSAMPFVPEDPAQRATRCGEILQIQARGLAARLRASRAQSAVVAISGGLDATLALIVTAKAFDLLQMDRKSILAVTMPGFGTTRRTRGNADALAEALGVRLRVIPIVDAVAQHFKDIDHDPLVLDVIYENAQARERTQIAMDLANKHNGLMVGTGDLSELALGWATYNGDHMSMYGVNASVPKTLIRHVVAHVAEEEPKLAPILQDILATPISPELLPPKDGEIAQITEDLVGPYVLHDFFLYYFLRFGFGPEKIYRMACSAFHGQFDAQTIHQWLLVFVRRFITQQYKRSCAPDAPQVGAVSFSPRGSLVMPSDASPAEWIRRVEAIR